MAKVLVANHVTLDGVMQAPARPDEDTRGGFARGGWAAERSDELMTAKIGERKGGIGAYLFGRRTYEDFHEVWGGREDNPFSRAFNGAQKYVASRSLREPLSWQNSTLLEGDAAAAVAELKQRLPGSLTIFGSGELVASLMAAELIDEYLLLVHPLVLGGGRRLFEPGQQASLRLIESVTTPTGVVISTYEPAR
jgi:dihydrofolate reductase